MSQKDNLMTHVIVFLNLNRTISIFTEALDVTFKMVMMSTAVRLLLSYVHRYAYYFSKVKWRLMVHPLYALFSLSTFLFKEHAM